MKFGLFYEIQVPKPWAEDTEHQAFHEAIEQAVLADQLGFDVIWSAEHHFLEEYSHNSAPEIFLAAVAAKTDRIRIGHGIKHLTTNHPLRVAEQAATLDIISSGRLELGFGEGSNTTELHPFGVRFRDKRELWEDAVKATVPAFWNTSWSYESDNFSIPPRNVLPKPFQKPHPPLWVACSQMKTILDAARWGMGAMGFAFLDDESARAWVNAYYNEYLRNLSPLAKYQTNPNITCSYYFSCGETDEAARQKAEGATFFEFSLGSYQKDGPFEAGTTDFWRKYLEWRKTEKAARKEEALSRTQIIGSPETLRVRLRDLHSRHIDQVLLLAQTGKTTHQEICESLELFADKVMPEFQALEDEHQEWKRKVLQGEIVLQDYDTAPLSRHGSAIDQSLSKKIQQEKTFAGNL